MDFGVVGLDGLGGSDNGLAPLFSEAETREKWCGSLVPKQGRSGLVEDDWRVFKMAKTDDIGVSKAMLMQSKNPSAIRSASVFPDGQQQLLLSFSSPKSDGVIGSTDGLLERSYQSAVLPFYHLPSSYGRNAGVGSGSLNGNMHCGTMAGVRGPFTPSQWIELEHQALIYKHLTANVPIPSNLLNPLGKSLCSTGFPGFSAGHLRPNSLGWGSFHLGFSSSTDPEPGRCRRTDGKKWRCSRDAVADQKYCERHMNRGRHRSRKPVEGQTGHASSGTAVASKAIPAIASSSASTVPNCGTSNSLTIAQQQIKSLQPGVDPTSSNINRMLMNKLNMDDRMQDSQSLSILSSGDQKTNQIAIPKPHTSLEETSHSDFGLVPCDSLVNPHRSSYDLNDQDSQSHPLRHFIDNWPKSPSDRSAIAWPEVEKTQSDRTQLSISIPVASSDFSSSTSSPAQDRVTLSPLKLSCELDPIQMGLGVGAVHESTQRQTNWIPISWESSMGGPLGEVLKSTNHTPKDQKNSSSVLNLMTEGWDASPHIGSSPTGVLQKTTFGTFSNSSTGSSPRTEVNKAHDHSSLCDDLLGSTLVNSCIPSL